MSEFSHAPKGWAFETIDAAEEAYGWVQWVIYRRDAKGLILICLDGRSNNYAEAREEAARAAIAWDRGNAGPDQSISTDEAV